MTPLWSIYGALAISWSLIHYQKLSPSGRNLITALIKPRKCGGPLCERLPCQLHNTFRTRARAAVKRLEVSPPHLPHWPLYEPPLFYRSTISLQLWCFSTGTGDHGVLDDLVFSVTNKATRTRGELLNGGAESGPQINSHCFFIEQNCCHHNRQTESHCFLLSDQQWRHKLTPGKSVKDTFQWKFSMTQTNVSLTLESVPGHRWRVRWVRFSSHGHQMCGENWVRNIVTKLRYTGAPKCAARADITTVEAPVDPWKSACTDCSPLLAAPSLPNQPLFSLWLWDTVVVVSLFCFVLGCFYFEFCWCLCLVHPIKCFTCF